MKAILKAIGNYIRDIDKILIGLCVLATTLSVVFLTSIQNAFPGTYSVRIIYMQIAASAVGLIAIMILSLIDYHVLTRLWVVHFPLCVLLVLTTFVIGVGREGADDRAWLSIFGVSVQPSEFLKLSFILTFAAHVKSVHEKITFFPNVLLLALHGMIPIGLVAMQGDDGSALIFSLIFIAMMFSAGVQLRYFLLGIGAVGVAIPFAWKYVLSSDQKLRFLVLFDDSASPIVVAQQNAGLKSIGSGQIVGTGLFQDHLYVPEMQNDMIFAFIGGALGFIGCIGVLLLLTAICTKILFASRKSTDISGKIICTGVFAMIAAQTVVNVGMNLKLLPVIGITLPFFSAGGSSVLATYASIGLVMSVYMHSKKKSFF